MFVLTRSLFSLLAFPLIATCHKHIFFQKFAPKVLGALASEAVSLENDYFFNWCNSLAYRDRSRFVYFKEKLVVFSGFALNLDY